MVEADDRQALERLAAYILRPSFDATRLRYQPARDRSTTAQPKAWPDPWTPWTGSLRSYLTFLTPACRWCAITAGIRMPPAGSDDWRDKLRRLRHLQINRRPKPIAFPEPDVRALARLLRKIYEVDPLTCPRCRALMKVVSLIEQPNRPPDPPASEALGRLESAPHRPDCLLTS